MTLKVDVVQNTSGGPVTLTDQSAAKAWNRVNASTTIVDSFNVSSVTDDGTANTDTNFTSSMSNSNFSSSGDINYDNNGITWHRLQTTSQVNTRQYIPTVPGFYDLEFGVHVQGDLA